MGFIKKLRLYRIKTVLNIFPKFWNKSQLIAKEKKVTSWAVFKDMFQCFLKFGSSEDNYEQFHFFGKNDAYKDSFITWRRNMRIMTLFNTKEAKALFLNKVEWNRRFSKYVKRDWIYSRDISKQQFIDFLEKHNSVIVKAIDGACGQGIDKYLSSDLLKRDSLLEQIFSGDYIIEEVAVNVPEIKAFSPNSLNTIRIVTCVDNNGSVNLITTALRVGNGKTFKDNTHSGGLAAIIDKETGVIVTDGIDYMGESYLKHPVTGVMFKGFQVPKWKECLDLIEYVAKECKDARFVGWDVAVTVKGVDILEGNIPPGEDLTQADTIGRYREVLTML